MSIQLSGRALLTAVVVVTSFSFMIIGYDNGVMGGLINQPAFMKTFDDPGPTIVGLIVSLYEVGCFLGCIATFVFGENLGRRWSLAVGAIIMVVGALLQATSYTRVQIIIARIISGIGMGAINSTAPVLQAEFVPKTNRGTYVCVNLTLLNFGIFLSYWFDYAFAGNIASYAWRIPVILQCIFIFPVFIGALLVPETPRWLISHSRPDEAREVLMKLSMGRYDVNEVDNIYDGIVKSLAIEDSVGATSVLSNVRHLFKSDDIGSRRRFLIACSVQFFQQLGGINGIIYYAGTIFSQSLGFDSHMSALMSGFLNTWFFIASFIPWVLIDRIGRRPLLISMVSLMAICFAVMCGLVRQIQLETSVAHSCGAAAAAMLFIYEGAFTIGFQATVWVYPPEILPLRLRQIGTAGAAACNWIIDFMVVQITPVAIVNIGWRYYIIYAIFNACFVPVMYFFYPETKGLELEDVDRLFAQGSAKRMLEEGEVRTGNYIHRKENLGTENEKGVTHFEA